MVFVTNEIVSAIPPLGDFNSQQIENVPGIYPNSDVKHWGKNKAEVFAIISDTNALSPQFMPSFLAFKNTQSNPPQIAAFAYHPTDDPNAIILGICNALVESGISVGLMDGKGIIPKGSVAFLIPQKFY